MLFRYFFSTKHQFSVKSDMSVPNVKDLYNFPHIKKTTVLQ